MVGFSGDPMVMRWRFALACSVLMALATGGASAGVYVGEGEGGVPVYTSHPPAQGFRQLLGDAADAGAASAVPNRETASARAARERLEPLIQRAARVHGVDAALLRAVLHVESRFNPAAVSKAGAAGAMQLMPATARRYGVSDRADARQSVDAGARHLRDLLRRYDGNVALALSAYNAGEGAVERHARRIPPYRETLTYVPEVMARAAGYRDLMVASHE
jgi:soluble lytic murein transglycosylase-like protein